MQQDKTVGTGFICLLWRR